MSFFLPYASPAVPTTLVFMNRIAEYILVMMPFQLYPFYTLYGLCYRSASCASGVSGGTGAGLAYHPAVEYNRVSSPRGGMPEVDKVDTHC